MHRLEEKAIQQFSENRGGGHHDVKMVDNGMCMSTIHDTPARIERANCELILRLSRAAFVPSSGAAHTLYVGVRHWYLLYLAHTTASLPKIPAEQHIIVYLQD